MDKWENASLPHELMATQQELPVRGSQPSLNGAQAMTSALCYLEYMGNRRVLSMGV